MHEALLDRLRCPFCGTRLHVVDNAALDRRGGGVHAGVIGCECCAFPVVDGIPVLVATDTARAAIVALEAGRPDDARDLLLGLDDRRGRAFRALVAAGDATYRTLIGVLSPDAEGTYFVYRFSDPTFLMADAVLTALAADPCTTAGWTLDVCGGSGHLARSLLRLRRPESRGARTVLADVYFWKLWLARAITAPGADAVCCDANDPLPFARGTFSLAVLSDAFPYLWRKRLLADELMRAVGEDGAIVLPHLHSADGWNHSQGMALTPPAYAALFAPMAPRIHLDRMLMDGMIDARTVDLSAPVDPATVGTEPSITLIAGRRVEPRGPFVLPPPGPVADRLAVNPLYRVQRDGSESRLTLTFPTAEYADEFGACTRYLPSELTLPADLTGVLDDGQVRHALGDAYADLRRRRVLLDVPQGYC